MPLAAHLAKLPSAKYANLVDHAAVLFETADGWIRVHQTKDIRGGPARLMAERISPELARTHTITHTAVEPDAVAARANDFLARQDNDGVGDYSAVDNNCEHWATAIFYGQPRSGQVQAAVAACAVVAIGGLLIAALASSASSDNRQA